MVLREVEEHMDSQSEGAIINWRRLRGEKREETRERERQREHNFIN